MIDRIQSVYDNSIAIMEAETGWNNMDSRLTVYYPSGHAGYNYSYNKFTKAIIRERIDLPYGWEDWQFRHEIGHAIMTALYNWRHDYLPGTDIYCGDAMWAEIGEGCALREGWATYCQAILSGRDSKILDEIRHFNFAVAIDVAAWLYQVDNPRWIFEYFDEKHPKLVSWIITDVFKPTITVTFGGVRSE